MAWALRWVVQARSRDLTYPDWTCSPFSSSLSQELCNHTESLTHLSSPYLSLHSTDTAQAHFSKSLLGPAGLHPLLLSCSLRLSHLQVGGSGQCTERTAVSIALESDRPSIPHWKAGLGPTWTTLNFELGLGFSKWLKRT